MIHPRVFGGESAGKGPRSPAAKALILPEVRPEPGRGLAVRQVFAHFQNLNLCVLIEDLRRGRVAQGNWSFANYLCPVAHGLPTGQAVGALQYLSQAVDLPRACRQAADDTGMPARWIERFVLSWDTGGMSPAWLLAQLQAIWAERLADAEAVQQLLGGPTPARQGEAGQGPGEGGIA